MSVRSFVCSFTSSLSRALNLGDKLSRAVILHHSRSETNQRAIEQSGSTQRALGALKSESNSRSLWILRLVSMASGSGIIVSLGKNSLLIPLLFRPL